jgi:DNA-binding CsgD family transcriptional regulator
MLDLKIFNLKNKYKLNKREVDVINLIVQENSTSKIASILGLKSNTISTIKKSIFLKLQVNSTIGLYKLIMES